MGEIILMCVKEYPEHLLVQSSISKSNDNDKYVDCFINIYAHTDLVDWLYRANFATVCKCMAM